MATIDSVLMNIDNSIDNANIAKEVTLQKLLDENIIDQETFNVFNEKWQIIILKKSWFKRITEWKDKNDYFLHITKMTV